MPTFIRLASLTEQGIRNIHNLRQMLEESQHIMEQHGVKLVHGWATLGEYDIVAVVDAADNVSVAGLAIDFAAGGTIKDVKTTPLISWEDGVKAMRKAGQITYSPYKPAAKKPARKSTARKTARKRR